MVPSSSGPGRLVLIQKIAGSTPAGITKAIESPFGDSIALNIITLAGVSKRCWQDYTADGKAVTAVVVILRVDIRRVRIQVASVCGGITSIRPPVAICDTIVDVAIRAIVVARTEKVTKTSVMVWLRIETICQTYQL